MPVREKRRRPGGWRPACPVLWSRPGSHSRRKRSFVPVAAEGPVRQTGCRRKRDSNPRSPVSCLARPARLRRQGGAVSRPSLPAISRVWPHSAQRLSKWASGSPFATPSYRFGRLPQSRVLARLLRRHREVT
jgi:hypothetical protein